jgi:hypothetical protein
MRLAWGRAFGGQDGGRPDDHKDRGKDCCGEPMLQRFGKSPSAAVLSWIDSGVSHLAPLPA